MDFSCEDTFTFLRGETCRRIASKQIASAPAVSPDDVLQETAADLWHRLRTANGPCPTPKECPLNRGHGAGLCPLPLDDPDAGEHFVTKVVLNAARRLRKPGTRPRKTEVDGDSSRERVDWPEGDPRVLENAASRASRDDNPLDFLGLAEVRLWAPKLLDRYFAEWKRIGGDEPDSKTEPPQHVFPDIGRTKIQQKLAAVKAVLRMEASSAAEGLRMADPHFYGSIEEGTPIENHQAQNTTRHSRIVNRILWQIWKAEMGDEA